MAGKILVTGATGFIGGHCILDLLHHGYEVRGTLRDMSRADHLRSMLSAQMGEQVDIELVSASLTEEEGWSRAIAGCEGVFHLASPVPVVQPKDPFELIEPARQGTLNVLRAARDAGVRRVVLTSSVAAVQGTDRAAERTFTAEDWSDPHDPDLQPYSASKTVAELAAWQFVEDHDLELAVVNPALVLGPALEKDYGSSLEALYKLMTGEVPLIPRFGFEIVDVRDVVTLHRLVYETPEAAGKRFLCGAGFRWFIEVADLLRKEFPECRKIPKRTMPNVLARVFAVFVKEIELFLDDLDKIKKLDCSPALDIGWHPRSPEEAIIDGARSLLELGIVKP